MTKRLVALQSNKRTLFFGSSFAALAAFVFAIYTMPAKAQTDSARLPQMTELRFGQTGMSFSATPLIVGAKKKFFEAENLKVDIVISGQSAAVCQQLLAKAVEIGDCSLNDVMQIVQMSGAPLVLVSNEVVTALNYGMMSKPSIKSWDDMKGKSIIVGGPKDNTVYYTRLMARAHGVKDSDYTFQYAGASGARYAALKSGAVDAAILTDPFDAQAELEGYPRLDDLRPKYIKPENYAGGGVVTTRDWAKAHPKELAAFIKALHNTVKWIYDPANKDELFSILQSKINVTRDAFDRTYQKHLVEDKMWAIDSHAIDSAVQGVLDSLVDIGSIPPPAPKASQFYDNTYVDLAAKSGS